MRHGRCTSILRFFFLASGGAGGGRRADGGEVAGAARTGSGQQVLQRRVVQLVDVNDVVQVLQVPLRVSHEVRDPGPGERRQGSQPLHVFKGHLRRERGRLKGGETERGRGSSFLSERPPTLPREVNILKSMDRLCRRILRIPSR